MRVGAAVALESGLEVQLRPVMVWAVILRGRLFSHQPYHA